MTRRYANHAAELLRHGRRRMTRRAGRGSSKQAQESFTGARIPQDEQEGEERRKAAAGMVADRNFAR